MTKKIVIILMFLVTLYSVNAALTDNLIAWYDFNANASNVHNPGTNDGDVVGATLKAGGVKNNYYNFSGTGQYINLSNTGSELKPAGSDEVTINAWIKKQPENPGDGKEDAIFEAWTGNNAYILRYDAVNDELDTYTYTGGNDIETNSVGVETDTWMMVTLVYNGTTLTAWLNGTLLSAGTAASGNMGSDSNDVYIGLMDMATYDYFKGGIDEVAIWSRDLSPEEIQQLYNSSTGLTYSDLSVPYAGPEYFYDSVNGDDNNDCSTVALACKTITDMNTKSLNAGDTVYFVPNSTWYTPLDAIPSITNGVTYKGLNNLSGDMPQFIGAIHLNGSNTSCWTEVATNIWKMTCYDAAQAANDFYTLYATDDADVFETESNSANLNSQDEMWYNRSGDSNVYVYSVGNPNTVHTGSIYIAKWEVIWDLDTHNDFTIEGLEIAYSSRGGIGSGTDNDNILLKDNYVHHHGTNDCSQSGAAECVTGTGNCIGTSLDQYNTTVIYNNVSHCWDACASPQSWATAGAKNMTLVNYSHNILSQCFYGFEFFNSVTTSWMQGLYVTHNTIDPKGSTFEDFRGTSYRCTRITTTPNDGRTSDIHILNNVCVNGTYYVHEYNTTSGSYHWRDKETEINYNYYEDDYNTFWKIDGGADKTFANWQSEGYDLNGGINTSAYLSLLGNYQPTAESILCGSGSDGSDVGAIPCLEGGTNVSNQMYQALSTSDSAVENFGTDGTYNHSLYFTTVQPGNWTTGSYNTGNGYDNYMITTDVNDDSMAMYHNDAVIQKDLYSYEIIGQMMPIQTADVASSHCVIGSHSTMDTIGWRNTTSNMEIRYSDNSVTTYYSTNITWNLNSSRWLRLLHNATTQNTSYYYKNQTLDSWTYLIQRPTYDNNNALLYLYSRNVKCGYDNVIFRRIGNEQNGNVFAPSFVYHSLNDTVWKSATIQYHDSVGSVYNDTFNNPTHATDMSRTLYPSTWTLNITLCDNNNICTNTTTKPVTTYNSKIVNITDVAGNPISSFCTFNGTSYTGSDLNLSMIDVTDLTLSCSAQPGFEAFTTEIVLNSSNQAVTRNSAMLFITFSETVYVVISDASTVAYYQNTTTINMTQTNLSIGKVRIDYGTTENHGQVYEYYNDWNTNINETLQVLDNMDTNFYAAAETASGYRLDDAYIYVYQYNKTSDLNSMNMVQTGQYMTDNKKPTLINLDSDKLYWIQVEKSGYSAPPLKNIHPDNITGSLDAPFVFELTKSSLDITSPWATWVTPYPLINTSPGQDITLHTQLPTYATIATSNRFYITTNYRESDGAINGLALTTINSDARYWKEMTNIEYCDAWGLLCADTRRFTVTLVEGVDFNWNDTQINITMLAYYDLYYRYDSTIVPLVRTDVGIITIETDTGWSSRVIAVVIFVILILGAAFIKYFTQSQDMAFHTYMIGLVAISALSQSYYSIAAISVIYYGLRWVSQASGGGGDA